MNWTAVIPLKGRGERKTRLAGRLGPAERGRLSQQLFGHVRDVLGGCADISEIALLSDIRPEDWDGRFFTDEGRGLNGELAALAGPLGPLLVIHADLPLLRGDDVSELLAQAEGGCAIAPDREGGGTNAIALMDAAGFPFAFGPGSFARHLAATQGRARVVTRLGLGLDIDTPADLDAAVSLGFTPR